MADQTTYNPNPTGAPPITPQTVPSQLPTGSGGNPPPLTAVAIVFVSTNPTRRSVRIVADANYSLSVNKGTVSTIFGVKVTVNIGSKTIKIIIDSAKFDKWRVFLLPKGMQKQSDRVRRRYPA